MVAFVVAAAVPGARAQDAVKQARDIRAHVTLSALLANQRAHPGDRDLGGGAAFSFGVGWEPVPLVLGFDVMVSGWGHATRRVRLDGARASLVRSGYSIFCNSWLRLQPRLGRFVPYVEALVGLKTQYTDFILSFDHGIGTTTIYEAQRWTWAWGVGGGLQYILGATSGGGHAYVAMGLRWLRDGGRHTPRREDHHLDSSVGEVDERFVTLVAQLGFGMSGDFLSTRR